VTGKEGLRAFSPLLTGLATGENPFLFFFPEAGRHCSFFSRGTTTPLFSSWGLFLLAKI